METLALTEKLFQLKFKNQPKPVPAPSQGALNVFADVLEKYIIGQLGKEIKIVDGVLENEMLKLNLFGLGIIERLNQNELCQGLKENLNIATNSQIIYRHTQYGQQPFLQLRTNYRQVARLSLILSHYRSHPEWAAMIGIKSNGQIQYVDLRLTNVWIRNKPTASQFVRLMVQSLLAINSSKVAYPVNRPDWYSKIPEHTKLKGINSVLSFITNTNRSGVVSLVIEFDSLPQPLWGSLNQLITLVRERNLKHKLFIIGVGTDLEMVQTQYSDIFNLVIEPGVAVAHYGYHLTDVTQPVTMLYADVD